MTILINHFIEELAAENPTIIRFKAPKNKMFHIEEISFSNIVSGANNVFLIGRNVSVFSPTGLTAHKDMMFVIRTVELIMSVRTFETPLRKKYLSAIVDAGADVIGHLLITGRIERASRNDLIWEWWKNG